MCTRFYLPTIALRPRGDISFEVVLLPTRIGAASLSAADDCFRLRGEAEPPLLILRFVCFAGTLANAIRTSTPPRGLAAAASTARRRSSSADSRRLREFQWFLTALSGRPAQQQVV